MKWWLYRIVLVVFLAGCQPVETIPTKSPSVELKTPTLISTSLPTSTATVIIPATPMPCPVVNPKLIYSFLGDENSPQSIEDFLNEGGDPDQVDDVFDPHVKDLNDDGQPEIVVKEIFPFARLHLFSCVNGKYVDQLPGKETDIYLSDFTEILAVDDLNLNGFPEVIAKTEGCLYGRCGNLIAVEWDGEDYSHIIKDELFGNIVRYASMSEPQDVYIKDLDADGIPELVWTGEVTPEWHSDHWSFYPQRLATHIYRWNGKNYAALAVQYSPPEFRFQAVQDGDRFALMGDYQRALELYALAVENEELDWWTEDRWFYIIGQHELGPCAHSGTPCPQPTPDSNERPILSAYATYRTILVYLLQNNQSEAEKTYQVLLETYTSKNPGYPFVEMATLFWNQYQSSRDMAGACALVVAHVVKFPDLLMVLSGASNGQGIPYHAFPDEVCPFN